MTATATLTAPADSGRHTKRTERGASDEGGCTGVRIERNAEGQLIAHKDGKAVPVRVVRCFPWTAPGKFVSLRDEQDHEIALVREAAELHGASREAFEMALAEAGFVFEIERIDSATEVYEVRHWKVRTRQGERRFQTKLDEWPRELPGGGFLVRDVSGDLYCVPDPEQLDPQSRRILWALAE